MGRNTILTVPSHSPEVGSRYYAPFSVQLGRPPVRHKQGEITMAHGCTYQSSEDLSTISTRCDSLISRSPGSWDCESVGKSRNFSHIKTSMLTSPVKSYKTSAHSPAGSSFLRGSGGGAGGVGVEVVVEVGEESEVTRLTGGGANCFFWPPDDWGGRKDEGLAKG